MAKSSEPSTNYEEFYIDYYPVIIGMTYNKFKYNQYYDVEDIAADIITRMIERDVISLYDANYGDGNMRFDKYISAMTGLYLKGKLEHMQMVNSHVVVIYDQPTRSEYLETLGEWLGGAYEENFTEVLEFEETTKALIEKLKQYDTPYTVNLADLFPIYANAISIFGQLTSSAVGYIQVVFPELDENTLRNMAVSLKRFIRTYSSEDYNTSTLSIDGVNIIRSEYCSGKSTVKDLAYRYRVSEYIIRRIINNQKYYDPDYVFTKPPVVGGRKYNAAKLNLAQAKAIREEYSLGGVTARQIAQRYGMSNGSIESVINNRSWVDPEYTPPTSKSKSQHKLNLYEVKGIREEYYLGYGTFTELSNRYKISYSSIQDIVNNRTYSDPSYTRRDPIVKSLRDKAIKLTRHMVTAIREEFKYGYYNKSEISRRYGISQSTVGSIISNEIWTDEFYTSPNPKE